MESQEGVYSFCKSSVVGLMEQINTGSDWELSINLPYCPQILFKLRDLSDEQPYVDNGKEFIVKILNFEDLRHPTLTTKGLWLGGQFSVITNPIKGSVFGYHNHLARYWSQDFI